MSRSKPSVKPVVWTFSALADVQAIRRYVGSFNPHAVRDIVERIIEAGNSLTTFPYLGRVVPGTQLQLRETALARPYIIRYRSSRTGVVILRVRHGALTRRLTERR